MVDIPMDDNSQALNCKLLRLLSQTGGAKLRRVLHTEFLDRTVRVANGADLRVVDDTPSSDSKHYPNCTRY